MSYLIVTVQKKMSKLYVVHYKLPEDIKAVHKVQVTEQKYKYNRPIMRNYHKNKHYKRDGISFRMGVLMLIYFTALTANKVQYSIRTYKGN